MLLLAASLPGAVRGAAPEFGGTLARTANANELAFDVSSNETAGSAPITAFVIAVNGVNVTGGSGPDGWTCGVASDTGHNAAWACQGGQFLPGTRLGGTVTTDRAAADNAGGVLSVSSDNFVTSRQFDLGGPQPAGKPDLSVQKFGSPNPVHVGGSVAYTIVVTNKQTAKATAATVEVTDIGHRPDEIVDVKTTKGTCNEPTGDPPVDCTIGTLAPGERVVVVVTVKPQRLDLDGLEDRARVTSSNAPAIEAFFYTYVLPRCSKKTICGRARSDSLVGDARGNVIDGKAGNDTIDGRGGNDHLYGAAGNDRIQGGPGNDVLSGGPGENVLKGGPGKDTCFGGPDDTFVSCEDIERDEIG